MAQKVQVTVVCDMHDDEKTSGTENITFAVDGASYEIDVCDAHAAELRDAFAPFVAQGRRTGSAGRRAGRPAGTGGRGRGGANRSRTAEMRRWARDQGRKVPERGRLPREVIEAYEAAH